MHKACAKASGDARTILSVLLESGLVPLSLLLDGLDYFMQQLALRDMKAGGGAADGKEREDVLSNKEKQLLEALSPRAAQEGVEIVTIEVVGSKKSPTIRVYIDTDHGVSFDELSVAQAWINDIMDEIDPFPGAYMLEVSSPGIDRPLRTPEHFARFAGQTAQVKTKGPLDGRSSFTGTIVSADEEAVVLDVDGAQVSVPMDVIKRAHLKGTVDFGS